MMKNKKNAFTLVELLAVIVILAIILVIAVPKVMSIIKDAKKGTLETTAKMIASAAEKKKLENTILESDGEISCKSVTKLNDKDYPICNITFDGNTAKVTITGGGQFEGLHVCEGTKTLATATEDGCGGGSAAVGNFAGDSWETIVAAVKQASDNGEPYPYEVGREKTIEMDIDGDNALEQYTIRVANTTKCSELEQPVTSKTACGFVLEFADIISTHVMNDSSTNAGGWEASAMRTYVNGTIYNLLPEKLKEGIIKTTVVSSNNSEEDAEDYLYLLSKEEVFGTSTSTATITRQLDYYENYGESGVTTSDSSGAIKNYLGSASTWWWRSVYSKRDDSFLHAGSDGLSYSCDANSTSGVSPAFRLGN